MIIFAVREKSSQIRRIYFAALRDEKNREVCLISRNGVEA
jgi:hypothetical protein